MKFLLPDPFLGYMLFSLHLLLPNISVGHLCLKSFVVPVSHNCRMSWQIPKKFLAFISLHSTLSFSTCRFLFSHRLLLCIKLELHKKGKIEREVYPEHIRNFPACDRFSVDNFWLQCLWVQKMCRHFFHLFFKQRFYIYKCFTAYFLIC